MKEEAGAGWGLIQGKRVASEPLENRRQNRWKTAGGHWQNGWKTVVELPGNRLETAGKPLENPPQNRRKTTGKNCRKTTGKNCRKNRRKPPGKAPFLGHFCQSQ